MNEPNVELRTKAVAMWNDGMSQIAIATALGVTTRAVGGQIRRARKAGTEVIVQPSAPFLGISTLSGFTGPCARTCQWIENDPRIDPRKCGQGVKRGSSYCDLHYARCCTGVPPRTLGVFPDHRQAGW